MYYENSEGEKTIKEDSINLTIEEKADFDIMPALVAPYSGEKDKKITYKLVNVGNKKAEDVKVILRASYPFTPTGGTIS